jgi:hypothetical protein
MNKMLKKIKDYDMKWLSIFLMANFIFICSCSATSSFSKSHNPSQGGGLTQEQVASGLKEALIQGVNKGSDKASLMDGFYKNLAIQILLPEDARRVEKTLRQVGLGPEMEKAILNINRAAEAAAKEAKPIFVQAIREMSIQDAFGILNGGQFAATDYLKKSTEVKLIALFQPIIESSLNKVGATKHYTDLAKSYNGLPLVNRKIDPDLNAYVTQKAIDGLFVLIAEEEKNIRNNPLERSTDLLKRVFGSKN